MAAYFVAHQRGRDLNLADLRQFARGAYAVGDCDVTSEGHHGIPIQRECSVVWAANIGLHGSSIKKGARVIPAMQVVLGGKPNLQEVAKYLCIPSGVRASMLFILDWACFVIIYPTR